MLRTLFFALAFAVPAAALSAQDLYVSSTDKSNSTTISRFNGTTGAAVGSFGQGLLSGGVTGFAFNPGGNVLVLESSGTVRSFSGTTNTLLGTFATVGGTNFQSGLTFGPNGDLYSTRNLTGVGTQIVRMNGVTGAVSATYDAPSGVAGSNFAKLAFGTGGDIFVGYNDGAGIRRYNGTTGAFVGTFVPNISVADLSFGTGGDLFAVTGGIISRYNGVTGAAGGVFATPPTSMFGNALVGLAFGTDGDLFSSDNTGSILRYNGTTGALAGTFVSGSNFGSVGAYAFAPAPVPEPTGILAVFGLAAAGLAARRRGGRAGGRCVTPLTTGGAALAI